MNYEDKQDLDVTDPQEPCIEDDPNNLSAESSKELDEWMPLINSDLIDDLHKNAPF